MPLFAMPSGPRWVGMAVSSHLFALMILLPSPSPRSSRAIPHSTRKRSTTCFSAVPSMPETGENVAADFKISREDQDQFALRSQQRTAAAYARGFFASELIPVEIPQRKAKPLVVSRDEHPRPETTLEQLAKLPTPFRANGTVTAGNASGVNDGACALIIASEQAVKRFGLTPRARVVTTAT